MKIADLKVGDQVLITNFHEHYYDVCNEMEAFRGQIVTVAKLVANRSFFYIDEDGGEYYWWASWVDKVDHKVKKKKINPEAKLKQKKGELRKRLKERAGSGVSNYGSVYKRGESFSYQTNANDICHARLRHNTTAVAVLDMIGGRKERFTPTEYQSFLRYAKFVMTESASKDAFLFTNLNSYVQNGVWMNVEVTSSHLMSAITFLRMGSEYKVKLPLIDKLVRYGIPYGVAAVLGMSFRLDGDKYAINIGDNHSAFNTSADIQVLRRWADGDASIYKKGNPFRTHGSHWSVHSVFHTGRTPTIFEFLDSNIQEISGSQDVWGTKRAKPCNYKAVLKVARRFIDQTNEGKK